METERNVWQDVEFTDEGLWVVTYSQAASQEPVTEDESWWAWNELRERAPGEE